MIVEGWIFEKGTNEQKQKQPAGHGCQRKPQKSLGHSRWQSSEIMEIVVEKRFTVQSSRMEQPEGKNNAYLGSWLSHKNFWEDERRVDP